MEPTLLPNTLILVDDRVNNARFLKRNFQRPFHRQYDSQVDVTTFELVEPPLGRRHDVAVGAILSGISTAAKTISLSPIVRFKPHPWSEFHAFA
jgi:hypothetical protein